MFPETLKIYRVGGSEFFLTVILPTEIFCFKHYTGCGKKVAPRFFFAIFSGLARNFNAKFYTLTQSSNT